MKPYDQTARTEEEIRAAVDALMAQMTLEEKIGQLVQSPGPATSEIGMDIDSDPLEDLIRQGRIGSTIFLGEVFQTVKDIEKLQRIAVEESRLHIPLLFCQDIIHGYQTIFPIPLAWSCSFDLPAIEKAAHIAAAEASCAGLHVAFSPMVDVAHDPRWGRVAEGAGEDPYLASLVGQAIIRGFQGKNLFDRDSVMACVKHFLGYAAAEGGRDYNTAEFSETALRNTYLPPFKAAVEAGCASLMTSFNLVNGVPSVANRPLCHDLLRQELGFDGLIISDYNAVAELLNHGAAEDEADAARRSLLATLDVEMATDFYNRHLPGLIREGKVDAALVDDAVRRVLTFKYRTGLMEDPYRYLRPEELRERVLCKEHLAHSRKLAQESIVLLKNENHTLPLSREKKVALVGPTADSLDMGGCWQFTSFPERMVTIRQGLEDAGFAVNYEKGCDIHQMIEGGMENACAAVYESDVCVLCLGEESLMNGESASRQSIALPQAQLDLLEAVAACEKPVILLLTNGRPLLLGEVLPQADAVLETWFLGHEAGHAICDVLLGDCEPTGRLTMSFPAAQGQIPVYYNHMNTGRPHPRGVPYTRFESNYMDGPNEPLLPFGYGLSYTTFSYGEIILSQDTLTKEGSLTASVCVTNTGDRTGTTLCQLYLRDVAASIARPVQELKGFESVTLAPGESRRVSFTIGEPMLRFYNAEKQYVSEPGRFEVMIGMDSEEALSRSRSFRLV